MKKLSLALCCMIVLAATSFSQQPKTFLIDANHLVQLKNKLKQKDQITVALVDSLIKRANALLNMKPVSVMDKAFTPPSGSKHDYMSQAPYFWYDSSKPNGLPYLRRDGERNPEINKISDHKLQDDLSSATRILSLAYYFTGEEKYAKKATELLRIWFFDDATKMNPNLEYAQGIPGITTGRGIGIIETRSLTGIADAAGLLNGSKSWTSDDQKKLEKWYAEYLNWMLTSKNGKEERAAKNNHGTWYAVQAIVFAEFTGDKKVSKQLAEEAKTRLDSQMTAEGNMPLELARTNALGYSTMNLRGWLDLATVSEFSGTDIWRYSNAKGATLKTSVDWLTPYAFGEKKWTWQQISPYNRVDMYPILLIAAQKFNDLHYLQLAKTANQDNNQWMTDLLYKK
jgi:alginate lyase